MSSFNTILAELSAASALLFAGTTHAALVALPGGAEVLDTETNLVWLQDWIHSPNANPFGGNMTFPNAFIWASNLTVGGAPSGSWRLPTIGEYNTLWANAGSVNIGLYASFNILAGSAYTHSSTEITPGVMSALFDPSNGDNIGGFEDRVYFTTAVRAVPEPQTWAFAAFGVATLAVVLRRRTRARV